MGKDVVEKKDQHTVPRSYLKGWCDPTTPNGAFIWLFPREGGSGKRVSPRSAFTEEDFYTLPDSDGGRDLSIENSLGRLEGAFVAVRDGTLRTKGLLNEPERIDICAFMAAMLTRTPRFNDWSRSQWTDTLHRMEELERAPPEVKARRAGIPSGPGRSMGIDDVRKMATHTAPINVSQAVRTLTPVLCAMNLTVVETDSVPGFVTSDAPCVLFDPEARSRPWPYDQPGLAYPAAEVYMPVSPLQAVLLSWRIERAYVPVSDGGAREMNRLIRGHCYRSIVVSRAVTDPEWFEPMPRILRDG